MSSGLHCFQLLIRAWSLRVAVLAMLAIAVSFNLEAQSPDPGEQLRALTLATSLDREGMPPWHLHMSFDLYDLKGAKQESGTIEEWWDSPKHAKLVISSPSYSVSDRSTPAPLRESYLVDLLLKQVVHPVPQFGNFDHLEIKSEKGTFGKVVLSCLIVKQAGSKAVSFERFESPELCVQPDTDLLRIHFDEGQFSAVRNRLGTFGNTSVALDNSIDYGNRAAITGHVDTLQGYQPTASSPVPVSNTDDAVHVPSIVLAGKIIKKVPPIYPEEAKLRQISGSVILCGLISKQGAISSLDVVASPDPSLSQAALDAVKQWVYLPYLLNGQPTEVDTTITVNFNLSR